MRMRGVRALSARIGRVRPPGVQARGVQAPVAWQATQVAYRRVRGAIFGFDVWRGQDLLFRTQTVSFKTKKNSSDV